MEIQLDRDKCIGSGLCVLTAPDVFGQDPLDGRVRLLVGRLGSSEAEMRAADLCPSGALSLDDDRAAPRSAES